MRRKIFKKQGLFLSIELSVILIILLILVVGISLIGEKMINMYRANLIVTNVQRISESINQFKALYDFYPGDVPLVKLVGELSDVNLMTSVTNSTTKAEDTFLDGDGNSILLFDKALILPAFNMGTDTICARKSMLGSQQIYAAGLAVKNMLYQYDYSNGAFIALAWNDYRNNGAFAWDPNTKLEYHLRVDNINTIACELMFPILYSSQYNVYKNVWSGKPRIFIGRTSKYESPSSDLGTGPDTNAGFIPPELAYIIDAKIDDGLPFGDQSRVIAGEYYKNVTYTAPTAATPPIYGSRAYAVSKADPQYMGCTTLITQQDGSWNPWLRKFDAPATAITAEINFQDIHHDSIAGGKKVLSGNTTVIQGAQYKKNINQKFGDIGTVEANAQCSLMFLVSGV